jgi:hypothetical protein
MGRVETILPRWLPCRLVARGLPGAVTPLIGRWRIVEMGGWDRDAIDLVEPGFIEFARDGTGQFGFIAVRGWLDCRPVQRDGRVGVEFTWDGVDEGDQISGRGWASLVDDAGIEGHLFFHMGDDSRFPGRTLKPRRRNERTVSEYQYYEFLAVDRPLEDAEQAEVRYLSTRARITATSFVNE